MNILHFSTDDITGGAAMAAYRLHTELRQAGQSSRMAVRYKRSEDEHVRQIFPLARRPWRARIHSRLPQGLRQRFRWTRTPQANYIFNFDADPYLDFSALFASHADRPDVIYLHWITKFLTVAQVRRLWDHFGAPIIWVLHDQEPFTGGCHYSFGCERFTARCGRCPQLDASHEHDASRRLWERKQRQLAALPLVFIAPTRWSADRVRASSLFQHHRLEIIPLALDTGVFRPFDQTAARNLLHLPPDKRVLFFGATYLEDPRKGMDLLLAALHKLRARLAADRQLRPEDVHLLIAGSNRRQVLQALPFAHTYLGLLQDALTIALAHQAADVFVCPSVEDSGPMMIPEAMLCATPVVAFNTGIAPELITTGKTGYLAAYQDSDDLAHGLYTLLTTPERARLGQAARAVAAQAHAPERVISQHLALYPSLLAQPAGREMRHGEQGEERRELVHPS